MRARAIFLILYGVVVAWAASGMADLKQRNEESIFMTRDGFARYRDFRERIAEPRVFVARTHFASGSIPTDYEERHRRAAERLGDRSGVSVVTPAQLAPVATLNDPRIAIPRLRAPDALSLVFIVDASVAMEELIALMDDVRTDATLNEGDLQMSGLPWVNHLLDLRAEAIKTSRFPAMFGRAF
ncbi:MAG: hypothetical protein KDC38_14745, partial [Planctomycetes bacterium]|nr:hypothetical protein [Planctomycetota bacterium]